MKRNNLKLKIFLFIEVTFNISGHTIMTFTQKKQFFGPQPTSHQQKWTTDLLIRKHLPNFYTQIPHPPPTFRMDVINVWSLTEKDLKKESEWRDGRLQRLNIWSLSVTLFWFVSQSQIYVIRIKNKICYMIEVMSFKYLLFSQ